MRQNIEKMAYSKFYKLKDNLRISNLRIVSMLPGDLNGLPDAFDFSDDYVNNSIISLFDNISTLDCSLNAGSFDQIGQFNFNASANTGISLPCINFSACDLNPLQELSETISMNVSNLDSFELNCSELSLEYFNISDLFFSNSWITYVDVNSCKFNDLELDKIDLTGFSLKNETNIFVSTTNLIYQPSLFNLSQTDCFILSPIFNASLSNSFSDSNCFSICSFHTNRLAFASIDALTNPDQLISGNFFICSLTSLGTDKVIDTILNAFNPVKKHKNVELFKSFDCSSDVFFEKRASINISATASNPYLYFGKGGYMYDNGTAVIIGHN